MEIGGSEQTLQRVCLQNTPGFSEAGSVFVLEESTRGRQFLEDRVNAIDAALQPLILRAAMTSATSSCSTRVARLSDGVSSRLMITSSRPLK